MKQNADVVHGVVHLEKTPDHDTTSEMAAKDYLTAEQKSKNCVLDRRKLQTRTCNSRDFSLHERYLKSTEVYEVEKEPKKIECLSKFSYKPLWFLLKKSRTRKYYA